METWYIYRLTDHNECPPEVTYFNTKTDRRDCLQDIRESGKDLSLIDIDYVQVRKLKRDVVDMMNAITASPQFGFAQDEPEPEEEQKPNIYLAVSNP